MGYKFGDIEIDNQYDNIKTSYYKGTAVSGKLFFRDPQANNPYNLKPAEPSDYREYLIDIICNDYEVQDGGNRGNNIITRTLVSPYYVPYLKNNYYLLAGDMRSYCICGIGLEADTNTGTLVWRSRLAISGPPTPVEEPRHRLYEIYQIRWVLQNLSTKKYYAHAQGTSQYEWKDEWTANSSRLNASGSDVDIYFEAQTSYQLELCLEKISDSKRSPWVGCIITTDSRQYAGDGIYYWQPIIDPIKTNIPFTSPYIHYQREIDEDSTTGKYSMFPLYSVDVVSPSEINWDPNPFSTTN